MRDCIIKASSFAATDFPYYYYRQARQNSITSTISPKRIDGVIQFIDESIENVSKSSDELANKCVLSFAAYEYCVLLLLYGNAGKVYGESDEKISELKFVLRNIKSLRGKLLYFFSRLFGVKKLLKLIAFVK